MRNKKRGNSSADGVVNNAVRLSAGSTSCSMTISFQQQQHIYVWITRLKKYFLFFIDCGLMAVLFHFVSFRFGYIIIFFSILDTYSPILPFPSHFILLMR